MYEMKIVRQKSVSLKIIDSNNEKKREERDE